MTKGNVKKHVFTVGAFTMLSRVLGLVREMLQSRIIGAGVEQSAFTLAFAIPNMARKIFGEGALTAAFVPVFKGEVESAGIEKASKLARAVATMMLLFIAAFLTATLGAILGFHYATSLSYRIELTLTLVAILLPYMLAICGAAFGMGVLNSLGKFKASSFMPSLLNIVWIAILSILAFLPSIPIHRRITIVAVAILIGGFLQFAFMLYCMAKVGVKPIPLLSDWKTEKVKLVWRNTAIAAFGAGAVQINYMLDQLLAQLAAPWAAGVIGYAERLMDLPVGVIGVAFGTVLLPTFAGFFTKGDIEGAKKAFSDSVMQQMFVMIPAAFGLAIIAPVATRVVYEGGSFDPTATVRVARALAVYSLGLGFFGLQKSLIPWFQAQNDMKTPLRVSVATVIVNATLNILAVLLLPEEWRHVGLAASTVICAAIGCVIFVVIARRRGMSLGLLSTLPYIGKVVIASIVMVVAVWAVDSHCHSLRSLFRLLFDMITGGIAYGLTSLGLKTFQLPRKLWFLTNISLQKKVTFALVAAFLFGIMVALPRNGSHDVKSNDISSTCVKPTDPITITQVVTNYVDREVIKNVPQVIYVDKVVTNYVEKTVVMTNFIEKASSAPPVSSSTTSYVIQNGDNLSKVARKFKCTVNEIQKTNGIKDPNMIRAGMTIKIPHK